MTRSIPFGSNVCCGPGWNADLRLYDIPLGPLIEVGSNIGQDACFYSAKYPQKDIRSYDIYNFPKICNNSNLRWISHGLGSIQETGRILIDGEASRFILDPEGPIKIEPVCKQLPPRSTLHMNCEGCEYNIIPAVLGCANKPIMIQFGTHYYNKDSITSLELIENKLKEEYTRVFHSDWAWSRWMKKNRRCYLLFHSSDGNELQLYKFYNKLKSLTKNEIIIFSTKSIDLEYHYIDPNSIPKYTGVNENVYKFSHMKLLVMNSSLICDSNILIDYDAYIQKDLDYLFDLKSLVMPKARWLPNSGSGMIIKFDDRMSFNCSQVESEMDCINNSQLARIIDFPDISLDCELLSKELNYVGGHNSLIIKDLAYIHFSCYGKWSISKLGLPMVLYNIRS
jgi:hypothetical protein